MALVIRRGKAIQEASELAVVKIFKCPNRPLLGT